MHVHQQKTAVVGSAVVITCVSGGLPVNRYEVPDLTIIPCHGTCSGIDNRLHLLGGSGDRAAAIEKRDSQS